MKDSLGAKEREGRAASAALIIVAVVASRLRGRDVCDRNNGLRGPETHAV